MAITELYSSAGTTISTTEISLVSATSTLQAIATDGIYQVWVNCSTLAQGDEFLVKIKEKVIAGSTQRVAYAKTLAGGPQSQIYWVSPSLMLINGWDVTLTKIAGTDRSIEWSVRQIPATITELYTGSAVSVGGTPISLVSGTTTAQAITTDGIYQVFIEANNVASTDHYQLYQSEKVTSGGSQNDFAPVTEIWSANASPVWVTMAAILMHGWDFMLWKKSGTDRTFNWSIRQVT